MTRLGILGGQVATSKGIATMEIVYGVLTNLKRVLQSLGNPRKVTVITTEPDATVILGAGSDETRRERSAPRARKPAEKQVISPLAPPHLVISPAFKLVVWLVFVLIIASGATMIVLAVVWRPENVALATASNAMSTAFIASLGALLGLVGGKAIP
jgi:hypothetical protein